MEEHAGQVQLQAQGCWGLRNLCAATCEEECRLATAVEEEGGILRVTSAMRRYATQPMMMQLGCSMLANVAAGPSENDVTNVTSMVTSDVTNVTSPRPKCPLSLSPQSHGLLAPRTMAPWVPNHGPHAPPNHGPRGCRGPRWGESCSFASSHMCASYLR